MANKRKPALADRTIKVGGETYTLRFSVRAMAALQDHYELDSIDQVGQRLAQAGRMGVHDIAAVLWAGLRTHHRDLGLEDALDILDELGLADMQEVIGEAFASAVPDNADGGGEANGVRPPTTPGRSTGSSRKGRRPV